MSFLQINYKCFKRERERRIRVGSGGETEGGGEEEEFFAGDGGGERGCQGTAK